METALTLTQPAEAAHANGIPVAIGDALDHFVLERELGRGGMGIVYVAHDRSLDRRVALKVILSARDDDRALERFFREARAQARLTSPHVVPIHFVGRRGRAAYFAMELVSGEALEAVLDRRDTLDPERARRLMIEVASGLAVAHKAGFIHRDIKPSNLLVDAATDHVKIADFGLAKPMSGVGSLTDEGVVLGTPMYMAPEQIRAEHVDHRADMYALGCTFFHLLEGAPPYDGESAVAVLAQHLDAPVPKLRRSKLATIIERSMQKDREARFATYEELIAALEAAAPDPAEPAGLWIRVAAAVLDLLTGAAIIGMATPFGPLAAACAAIVWLALSTSLLARYGQTLGKHLVRIRVERRDGEALGMRRAALRLAIASWLPILVAIVILATRGHDDLFAILARASHASEMQSLVTAFAVGNVALTVLWMMCLALAGIHPQKLAVHDFAAGSRVVHVVRSASPRQRISAMTTA